MEEIARERVSTLQSVLCLAQIGRLSISTKVLEISLALGTAGGSAGGWNLILARSSRPAASSLRWPRLGFRCSGLFGHYKQCMRANGSLKYQRQVKNLFGGRRFRLPPKI